MRYYCISQKTEKNAPSLKLERIMEKTNSKVISSFRRKRNFIMYFEVGKNEQEFIGFIRSSPKHKFFDIVKEKSK